MEKIVNSGIVPTPEVEVLYHIWDWKKYALENLSAEELRNHSNYHCSNIKKEHGQTKLRAKRYLYETQWNPAPGIRLLKEDYASLEQIQVAPFRIEKLNMCKVYQDLQRYFVTLPLEERMIVQSSWEKLKLKLENLPNKVESLEVMNVLKLPVQDNSSQAVIPEHLAHINSEDKVKDLEGDTFPDDLDEADFDQEIKEGLDVLIYSDIKKHRPWVGRVLNVTNLSKFQIHWFERRKGDMNMYYAACNRDGSPYTSEIESASVILWNFSTRIDDASFSVSKFFLNQFKVEYSRHDALNNVE